MLIRLGIPSFIKSTRGSQSTELDLFVVLGSPPLLKLFPPVDLRDHRGRRVSDAVMVRILLFLLMHSFIDVLIVGTRGDVRRCH